MNTPKFGTRLDDKLNLILIAVGTATLLTFTVAAWNDDSAELAAAPVPTPVTVAALDPAAH